MKRISAWTQKGPFGWLSTQDKVTTYTLYAAVMFRGRRTISTIPDTCEEGQTRTDSSQAEGTAKNGTSESRAAPHGPRLPPSLDASDCGVNLALKGGPRLGTSTLFRVDLHHLASPSILSFSTKRNHVRILFLAGRTFERGSRESEKPQD